MSKQSRQISATCSADHMPALVYNRAERGRGWMTYPEIVAQEGRGFRTRTCQDKGVAVTCEPPRNPVRRHSQPLHGVRCGVMFTVLRGQKKKPLSEVVCQEYYTSTVSCIANKGGGARCSRFGLVARQHVKPA